MKILFLDESGDHNLLTIDDTYPYFVLAGCIVDQKEHDVNLTSAVSALKKDLFGTDKIVLHYVDYTRNKNGFEKVKDKAFREEFYRRLNDLVRKTDFTLLSCIIDKKRHKDKYGTLALDPYNISLEVVIERFVRYLSDVNDRGIIVAESRGGQLDNELDVAFLKIKVKGTNFLKPKDIRDKIENFLIRKKGENVPGLQLVDTVVTPIGRRYANKKNYYLDYELIKSRFRKSSCGKYKGYGLVMLPK